ncbi:hypothetical protein ACIOD0_29175 [Kitasatospora albolonga]
MRIHHLPQDGLVTNDEVDSSYFSDVDRDYVVAAGVRLVNALHRFGIDIGGIGVSAVCGRCTTAKEPYMVELGKLRAEEADAMAVQIDAYALEFQRMRNRLTAEPEKLPTKKKSKRKRK